MINSGDAKDPLQQWQTIREAFNSDPVPQGSDREQRSSALVEQWRQLLPKECVDAMIKAGWHYRD